MRLFYDDKNYKKYLNLNKESSEKLRFFNFFIDSKKDFKKEIFFERNQFRSVEQIIFQNWFYNGQNIIVFFAKNSIENIQSEIALFCYICEKIALGFFDISRHNPQSYYEAQHSIWRENAKENRQWCHAFFKPPHYQYMKRKDFSNALKIVSKPYQKKENGNTELQERMIGLLKTVIIQLFLEKEIPLTLNSKNDFEKKSFKTLASVLKKNDTKELMSFCKRSWYVILLKSNKKTAVFANEVKQSSTEF